MGNRSIALLSALAVLTAMPVADAKVQRNQQERAVFMKQYPCPSNGRLRGPCPGYVVDHIALPAAASGKTKTPSRLGNGAASEGSGRRLAAYP